MIQCLTNFISLDIAGGEVIQMCNYKPMIFCMIASLIMLLRSRVLS